jgi:hypothetical protein
MRVVPAALVAALPPLAAAAAPAGPIPPPLRPSPIPPGAVGAFCYHHGLAYSEGAVLRLRVPDLQKAGAAEGAAAERDALLVCRRIDGALRWSLLLARD